MENALLIAVIVAVIGVLGTIVPGVPGLPLILISVIGYALFERMQHFSVSFLVIISVLGFIGIISEYLLAYLGAKYFGASRYALFGTIGGAFVGMFIFPPIGLIFGALAGAVAGEFYKTQDLEKSMRAAWGTVLGLLGGSVFRFLIALTIFLMFISKIY